MASSFPEPWFSHTQDNSDCGEAFFVMESSGAKRSRGIRHLHLILILKGTHQVRLQIATGLALKANRRIQSRHIRIRGST